MKIAAAIGALSCAALLRLPAAAATEPTHPVELPPALVRFSAGLGWVGARAGLTGAARIYGRFGAGVQGAAFTVAHLPAGGDAQAWSVGPVAAAMLSRRFALLAGGGYARVHHQYLDQGLSYQGYFVNGALEWLAASGFGIALRCDVVADPQRRVPADSLFTLAVELGPP